MVPTLPPVAARLVNLETLIITIELMATIAFAMSGLMEAVRKRMDVVGVFSVTFVSAFGGGTLRDVLLNRRTFFWVQHQEYVWLVLLLTLIVPLRMSAVRRQSIEKAMHFADACGLGLFTISGMSIALLAGMPKIVVIMMGTITATFGGVVRDVLCNEIPKAFHDHSPYALCSVVGGDLLLLVHEIGTPAGLASALGIISITGMRLVAVVKNWHIPAWPPKK